jgi:hypothetical protein
MSESQISVLNHHNIPFSKQGKDERSDTVRVYRMLSREVDERLASPHVHRKGPSAGTASVAGSPAAPVNSDYQEIERSKNTPCEYIIIIVSPHSDIAF